MSSMYPPVRRIARQIPSAPLAHRRGPIRKALHRHGEAILCRCTAIALLVNLALRPARFPEPARIIGRAYAYRFWRPANVDEWLDIILAFLIWPFGILACACWYTRKNGGIDLLNQIHQKRMGVVLLGWVDSGIRFNLWSTKEPKMDASGHIDIKGFKVRGNPIYNAFLTNYLGAQVINLPSTELYTALERGTVDLTAWTQIGLMDLNWDRYIKYRIGPDFFETDLMIIVNQKKWQSLAPKSREILQRVAIEHEVSSLRDLQTLWKKEQEELAKRGIKSVAQSPDASKRFIAGARAASLQRMKERIEKAGGMENYDKVVKLFTPD